MTTQVVVTSPGFTIQVIEHYTASDGTVKDMECDPIKLENGQSMIVGVSATKSVTIMEVTP